MCYFCSFSPFYPSASVWNEDVVAGTLTNILDIEEKGQTSWIAEDGGQGQWSLQTLWKQDTCPNIVFIQTFLKKST